MNRAIHTLALIAIITTATPTTNAQTYPIVDTGQTDCYDNYTAISAPTQGQAFYGQDAQHTGNQPSYTTSGDGLSVLDNVTGLTWTQGADWNGDGSVDVDDKFTYSELQGQADALNAQNYGGHSDWRVPSIKELYSLIDYRGTDPIPTASSSSGNTPFIDDSVFQFAYGDTAAASGSSIPSGEQPLSTSEPSWATRPRCSASTSPTDGSRDTPPTTDPVVLRRPTTPDSSEATPITEPTASPTTATAPSPTQPPA